MVNSKLVCTVFSPIPWRPLRSSGFRSNPAFLKNGFDLTSLYIWSCTVFSLIALRGVGRGIYKDYKNAKKVYPPRQKIVIEVPISEQEPMPLPCELEELFYVSMFLWITYAFFFGYVLAMCVHGNPLQSREVAKAAAKAGEVALFAIQRGADKNINTKKWY